MSRSFNSIRYRLIFLLILGLVPCVGLTLYGNLEQRRLSLIHAEESAFQSATDFAEVLNFMIDEMLQMLKVLAQEQQIRDLDMNVCSEFFPDFDTLFVKTLRNQHVGFCLGHYFFFSCQNLGHWSWYL